MGASQVRVPVLEARHSAICEFVLSGRSISNLALIDVSVRSRVGRTAREGNWTCVCANLSCHALLWTGVRSIEGFLKANPAVMRNPLVWIPPKSSPPLSLPLPMDKPTFTLGFSPRLGRMRSMHLRFGWALRYHLIISNSPFCWALRRPPVIPSCASALPITRSSPTILFPSKLTLSSHNTIVRQVCPLFPRSCRQ